MTSARGSPRLLLVVAHPDDETFGCGSLLLHAAADGFATSVVCATRGEAGERFDVDAPTGDDLGAVRERELRAAADVLGVTRVELLHFRDSGMSGPAGAGTLISAPADAVRDQVLAAVEEVRPHVVLTLDGSDGHRDHSRTRDATLDAVDRAQWRADRVYLQCLPKSLMQLWIEYMSHHDPTWEHLSGDLPGTPDELITTVIETDDFFAERMRAISMHASQRSPYDGLPDDLLRRFLTREYLQQVRPQPAGGDAGRVTQSLLPR